MPPAKSKLPKISETTWRALAKIFEEEKGTFTFDDFLRACQDLDLFKCNEKELRKDLQKLVRLKLLRPLYTGDEFIISEKLISELTKKKRITLDRWLKRTVVSTKTLDEIQAELERLEELTYPELIADLLSYDIDINSILEKIIDDLAKEDPHELLKSMLKELVDWHNMLVQRLRKESAFKKRERLKDLIDRIRDIIKMVYGRYLHIPLGPLEHHVIRVPISEEGMINFDEKRVDRYLEKRILDRGFIVETAPNTEADHFTGIDSSVHEIRPLIAKPPYKKSLPATLIFTVVSVNMAPRREGADEGPEFILRPEPHELASYKIRELEERGYVLRGSEIFKFLGDDEYYIKRVKEANMQKLQYHQVKEWNGEFIPDAIFIDGRIWPSEHKIDDFFAIHKRYVIETLRSYADVVRSLDPDSLVIIGTVKRGHLGFLWYVVHWYAVKKGYIEPEKFLIHLRFYESIESHDGILALKILLHYYRRKKRYGRLFAVRRKFYAIDEKVTNEALKAASKEGRDLIDREDETAFWKPIVKQIIVSKLLRENLLKKLGDAIELALIDRSVTKEGLLNVFPDELRPYVEGFVEKIVNLKEDELRALRERFNVLLSREEYLEAYELYRKLGGTDVLLKIDRYTRALMSDLPLVYALGDVVVTYILPPIEYDEKQIETLIKPPPNIGFALPRIELALPLQYWIPLIGLNNKDELRKRILNLVNHIAYNPTTWKRSEMNFYILYKEGTAWNLIVPAVVSTAHHYAKNIAKEELAPKYAALISTIISRLLRQE